MIHLTFTIIYGARSVHEVVIKFTQIHQNEFRHEPAAYGGLPHHRGVVRLSTFDAFLLESSAPNRVKRCQAPADLQHHLDGVIIVFILPSIVSYMHL